MHANVEERTRSKRMFRPRRSGVVLGLGFAIVTLALVSVFGAARWYAGRISLPRYCEDPEAAAALVERVLNERRPAGEGSTRPYVVAAKLVFIVPRRQGETVPAYATRLRARIEASCR